MSHPINVAFKAFVLDGKARRLKPATIDWYSYELNPFFDSLASESVTDLSGITPSRIRTFLAGLAERDLKDTTQHGAARAIRAFLNFCVREEWLAESPMKKVKMPKRSKRILPSFTTEEVQRILGCCPNERDRALVLFLIDTGLRINECANVQISDVDLQNGSVFVRDGKGGKDRIVYFGTRTKKQLMKYFMELGDIPTDGSLWRTNQNGSSMKREGLRMLFRRLKDESGIEHCSAHTCRRTFALWSLRSGMNIFALQQLMGHSSLDVLKRYLALVERDLQDAHKNYGAIDNML